MTSTTSFETDEISTAVATITSSPKPTTSSPLTTTEIVEITIGSVAIFFLLVIIAVCPLVRRRRSRQKYQHPEDSPHDMDTVELTAVGSVPTTYQPNDWHNTSNNRGNTPFPATPAQQDLNRSLVTGDSQSRHARLISVDSVHEDTGPQRGSETATLLSAPSSPPKSPIKPIPLSIPEMPTNHSNVIRNQSRVKGPRQSSNTLESLNTNDSVSIYSEPSIHYPSRPVTLPSVPPIALRLTPPTSSSPESANVMLGALRRDESMIRPLPPATALFTPLPPLTFKKDSQEEDYFEIRNIAKLLHSRQTTTSLSPSRESSIVSHIERSGSIRPAIPITTEDESYRPRYHRLKEKRSSSTNLNPSATHLGNPFVSILPSSLSSDSQLTGVMR